MRKISKILVILLLVLTLCLVSANGIFANQGKIPERVQILGGTVGGEWFGIGALISEMFKQEGPNSSIESGGGTANVIRIDRQEAELGFSMGTSIVLGRKGEDPFTEECTDVMAVCALYPNYVYIAVTEESGITSIEELVGESFATQPIGTTTQQSFNDVFSAYGFNEEKDLILSRGGKQEQKSLLKDRHVVGMSGTASGLHDPKEIDLLLPLRLLPIPDEIYEKLKEINSAYGKVEVNWKGEMIPTVNTHTYLIVNRNMPEDEVYWMTKKLVEILPELRDFANMKNLNEEKMSTVIGFELHPGARKYYEEIGVVINP